MAIKSNKSNLKSTKQVGIINKLKCIILIVSITVSDNSGIANVESTILNRTSPEKHTQSSKTQEEAEILAKQALLLYQRGNYNEAIEIIIELVNWSSEFYGINHIETANALDSLGQIYIKAGSYSKAEVPIKQALKIREQILGKDHKDTASSTNNLAYLYYELGEYDLSISLFKHTLELLDGKDKNNDPTIATILDNLAKVYLKKADFKEAERLLLKALAINEKAFGVNNPSTAFNMTNLGVLYLASGQLNKANRFLQQSLEITEEIKGADHPDSALILDRIGTIQAAEGNYKQAEESFKKALKINIKLLGTNHPQNGYNLANQADLYIVQGKYATADKLITQAISILIKSLGESHPDVTRTINTKVGLLHKQGQYKKAEKILDQLIKNQTKILGESHPEAAMSINNLARIKYEQGQLNDAINLYFKALKINTESQGKDSILNGLILDNIGQYFMRISRFPKATQAFEKALEIRSNILGPNSPQTLITKNNLAYSYMEQGMFERSESLFQEILSFKKLRAGENPQDIAVILDNLATLYLKQGLFPKAKPLIVESLAIENEFIQKEVSLMPRRQRDIFIDSFQTGHQRNFSLAVDDINFAKIALSMLLNRKGLLAEIEKEQSLQLNLSATEQRSLQNLRQINNQISTLSLRPAERKQLERRKEEMEKQIYTLLPLFRRETITLEQIASRLKRDSVLIEFKKYQPFDLNKPIGKSWSNYNYMAIILTPSSSVSVVDLGPAKLIDSAIESMVKGIEMQWSDSTELITKVKELVMDPLKENAKFATTWFVAPDGELNRLPFTVLSNSDEKNVHSSDPMEIHLLTTGRELLELEKSSRFKGDQILLLANPDFEVKGRAKNVEIVTHSQNIAEDAIRRSSDLRESLEWMPLPATEKEGKEIQKLIGGQLRLGSDATVMAIKKTNSPKIIHLASHAFYLPDQTKKESRNSFKPISYNEASGQLVLKDLQNENPLLRSGVVLAGANRTDRDESDDGYLTALEVSQLNLSGTELVVISGCDSGLGDIKVGEGIYGLKRAIAVAGARSSLLSLWKVKDKATAAFMTSFYTKLKTGMGRADALSATQKEFREHQNEDWREPYVWAAFQLSGDWGPIEGL